MDASESKAEPSSKCATMLEGNEDRIKGTSSHPSEDFRVGSQPTPLRLEGPSLPRSRGSRWDEETNNGRYVAAVSITKAEVSLPRAPISAVGTSPGHNSCKLERRSVSSPQPTIFLHFSGALALPKRRQKKTCTFPIQSSEFPRRTQWGASQAVSRSFSCLATTVDDAFLPRLASSQQPQHHTQTSQLGVRASVREGESRGVERVGAGDSLCIHPDQQTARRRRSLDKTGSEPFPVTRQRMAFRTLNSLRLCLRLFGFPSDHGPFDLPCGWHADGRIANSRRRRRGQEGRRLLLRLHVSLRPT
ncbi:uncharacterized protein IWZ02DRAFT_8775 [Phyllosticta citriasiana]|uniref:Uncharacterized protein n=1 Tax=Phyllosticta citriasiana TaxID=595635 RepID=A0ABR1KHI8_9PEZI